MSGRPGPALAAAAALLWLLGGGAAYAQPGGYAGSGTVLLPLGGERVIGSIELELEAAFKAIGQPVQRSELKLEDLMLTAGCARPTPACLQKIGTSVWARALVIGRLTREEGRNVKLTLRLFTVSAGQDTGRSEVLLPLDPGARPPLLAAAVRALGSGEAAPKQPSTPQPTPAQGRSGTLSISSSVPAVELVLDGQPRGSLPLDLRDLPPGRYRIEARKSGYLPWDETWEVFPGETTYVTVKLQALPAQATRGFFGSIRWPTWTVGGVGLASLIAAAGFGAHSLGEQSAFNDSNPRTYAEMLQMEDIRDSGQRSALAANILFGIGGAALVAAGVMAYFDYKRARPAERPAPPASAPRVLLGPGSIQLQGRF